MVKCYYVKKKITQDKIKEQKEYLYGTALQRVGDGEIPTGKYKGNGFVRCKANTDIKYSDFENAVPASSGCRVLTLQGKDIEEIPYRIEVVQSDRKRWKSTINKGWHHETYIRPWL